MSDTLLLAAGVALSPLPIVVLTMILSTTEGRALGSSFALGWAAGVTGSTVLLLALVGAVDADDRTPPWIAVAQLVVGLLFLGLALHIWRDRRREPAVETPRWLGAVDGLTRSRSAGLGLVLAAANPKNLALVLAAAIAIAQTNASSAATAAVAAAFVFVATAGVSVPLALAMVAPERASAALASVRGWLLRYDAVVLTILGTVIGAKLVYEGFTAL